MIGSLLANALAIKAARTTKAAAAVAARFMEAAACLMHAILDATKFVNRMTEAKKAAKDAEIVD